MNVVSLISHWPINLTAPAVARRGRRATSAPAAVQITHKQLTEVGDLLLDALRLECEFATLDVSQASTKELAEFRMCRLTVERLAEDYLALLQDLRQAAEKAAGCA